VKGLVADANIRGQVDYLAQRMQVEAWADFWQALGLVLRRFEDVGLSGSSTDLEVWTVCQAEQLILITDNRKPRFRGLVGGHDPAEQHTGVLACVHHRRHARVPNQQLLRGARSRGPVRLPPADR
jgi:hypothetical protein